MASGSVYNHRNLQPTGGGGGSSGGVGVPPPVVPGPNLTRINDAFEGIRQEFDILASDLGVVRAQRDEYEAKLSSQINELNIFRQQLYELENQHTKIRQQYEDEMARLRADLMALRNQNPAAASSGAPPTTTAPPPPSADPYFRDRDRLQDQRDPKRFRSERGRPDILSPGSMPKLPRLANPSSSSSSSGLPPALPPHPPPGPPYPPAETGGAPSSASAPSAGEQQVVATSSTGGFPDDLDIHSLPAEYKREGTDWFAIFNPKQKRVLDVQLVHALMHESVVCCVRFSADGKFLATGCNRTAQIYDVKTGQKTCVLADETASKAGDLYIRSVCFSPDSKYLATCAEDKQIRIWDIAKRRIRNVFDGHQQEIYSLDFSHDGRLIVSGSGDKTARIWDMFDGSSKVLTINDPDSLNNDAGVTSVAISPNGQLVAAGSLDTVVRIWDVPSGTLVERLRGHKDSVYSVAFTPDGKGLISGSLDKTLKYWDVSGLLLPGAVKARKEATAGVAGSPAGKREIAEKVSPCTMNFTGHKDYVLSVAVSHDGRWVVSGSKDRGVQFWDSATAAVQCMLQGHKNSVISIDLSPGGNILATGSGDWQARIWAYSSP